MRAAAPRRRRRWQDRSIASEVDGFVAINADGSVTIYIGKVDLGQGLRIAIPQMAAEELGIDVEQIVLVEGDTASTPDQGATGGSSGIMRGGRRDPAGRGDRARSADRHGRDPNAAGRRRTS